MKKDRVGYPTQWENDDDLSEIPYRVRDRMSRAKRAGKKLRYQKCKRSK